LKVSHFERDVIVSGEMFVEITLQSGRRFFRLGNFLYSIMICVLHETPLDSFLLPCPRRRRDSQWDPARALRGR
jgi:hypothetical protein